MADEFRGLTIRLGADARPLKSAISSIQRSAGQANKQLNAMKKALRFDGTNVNALERAIDLANDRAQLTAKSVVKIDQALKQASSDTRELAKETKDAYSKTQNLKDAYNGVDAQLQHVYDAVAKAVEKVGGLKETEAVEYVKILRQEMRGTEEAATKAKQEFKDLLSVAVEKTGISERFGIDKKDINAVESMTHEVKKLKDEHKKLKEEYDKFAAAEGYNAMKTQVIAWRSELRKAAAEIVEFETSMHKLGEGGELASMQSRLKRIDSGLDEARQSANRMSDAFDRMPDSMMAAIAKAKAFKDQAESAKDKVKQLEEILKGLKSQSGFDNDLYESGNVYGAYSKAAQKVEDIQTELKEAEAELVEWNQLLAKAEEKGEVAFGETKMSVNDVKQEIKETSERVERLGNEYREAGNKLRSATMAKEARQVKEEWVEATAEVERYNQIATGAAARRQWPRTWRTAGYGLYTTVTPALTMAARYSIDAAKDIDSAYRDMRKTVNGTEEEFEHLKQAAIDFSLTHVTSAEQMLEIEAIGGQLGVQVENLEGFAQTVSNLGIATNMETEDIATNLGQLAYIMDDMDQSQESLDSFADALVRLGNNSATQEDKIMNVMMRIASMGTILNMSTHDLLALSTAVAASGQGAEAAGTAISKTFSNIESAVSGPEAAMKKFGEAAVENGADLDDLSEELAESQDDLEAFAKIAGMTSEEFAAKWHGSSDEVMDAFSAFVEGLHKLKTDEDGSIDTALTELGIRGTRQKQTIMNLTQTVGELEKFRDMSEKAWNGLDDEYGNKAGDAMREAEEKSKGFSGQLGLLTNALKAFGEAIAEGTTPVLQGLTTVLSAVAKVVSGLPGPVKTLIAVFGGVGAAAGPAMVGIGAVADAWDKLVGASKKKNKLERSAFKAVEEGAEALEDGLDNASNKTGKLGSALKALGGIAVGTLAVAGISMIATAIGEAIEKAQTFDKATRGLEDAVGHLDVTAGKTTQTLSQFADETMQWQAEFSDKITSAFSEANTNGMAAQGYVDQIEQIKASWRGTEEDYQRLKAAVDGYNSAMGTSIEITDKHSGELSESTDQLRKNADAWLANARAQAAQELYQEGFKKQLEIEQRLEGMPEKIRNLKELAEEAAADNNSSLANMYLQQAAMLENGYEPLKSEYDSLVVANRKLADTMVDERMKFEAMTDTLETFRQKLAEVTGSEEEFDERARLLGVGPDELTSKLKEAGVSAEMFSRLTRDQFDQLRAEAKGDIDSIIGSIAALDKSSAYPTVGVNDFASSVLDRIKDKLNGLDEEKQVRVKAAVTSTASFFHRNAAGGLSSRVIRAIPRNAEGGINGIITRATLTNVGWVGEAGDEAVFHMRNAGGAIVPLSNQDKVRPFARAVASEIQPYSSDDIVTELRAIRSSMASGQVTLQVNVEARQWDDYEDVGRRVGEAAAYELRMQGVCA